MKYTYGVAVKLFLQVFIPPEPAKWMDGGIRSKLVQVVSYGQGHHYFYLILSKYLLHLGSESKKTWYVIHLELGYTLVCKEPLKAENLHV